MQFRRQPNCTNALLWEGAVDPAGVDGWCMALCERGFRDLSHAPILRILQDEAEHVLVIVPRTGRVQLRLSYLVPPEERPAAASRLGAALPEAPCPS
jgi:hypothetical protein